MIPKSIADKLRNGEQPLSTCQEFKSVSILFSDIVSFTPMCSRLGPMDVVCVLNTMCMAYDKLCEKHHVYKVRLLRSLSEKCVLFAVYTSSIKYCTYDIHNYVHVLFAELWFIIEHVWGMFLLRLYLPQFLYILLSSI